MKANNLHIDILTFREHFTYNKKTGDLFWSSHPSNRMKGQKAGSLSRGYIRVEFRKQHIYAHRIIWALVHGKFPDGSIDHVNGDKTDNRLANLRDVSQRANQQNLKVHRSGKLPGATYDLRVKKWIARIGSGYKETKTTRYLGAFDTELEAHLRYKKECNNQRRK